MDPITMSLLVGYGGILFAVLATSLYCWCLRPVRTATTYGVLPDR